jgi:hypothetical protein
MSSDNTPDKIEITVSLTKDGQTVKAVLGYDQINEIKEFHNQDLIETTIDILRQEIERGI